MGDRWHVEVDRSLCIGSGLCAGTAPEAFRLDGTRKARPLRRETPAGEEVLDAAENCPVEAIHLRLLDSGESVFPPEE